MNLEGFVELLQLIHYKKKNLIRYRTIPPSPFAFFLTRQGKSHTALSIYSLVKIVIRDERKHKKIDYNES